jgi:hypothetical protein
MAQAAVVAVLSLIGVSLLPWTIIMHLNPRAILHSMPAMIIITAFFVSIAGRLWVAEETFDVFTVLLSGVLASLHLLCRNGAEKTSLAWKLCTILVFGAGILWLSSAVFGIPEWRADLPFTELVLLILLLASFFFNSILRWTTKRQSRNTRGFPSREELPDNGTDSHDEVKRIAIDKYGLNSHNIKGRVAKNSIKLYSQNKV